MNPALLEQLRQILEFLVRKKLSLRGFDARFIDDFLGAAIESDNFRSHAAPPLVIRYLNS